MKLFILFFCFTVSSASVDAQGNVSYTSTCINADSK